MVEQEAARAVVEKEAVATVVVARAAARAEEERVLEEESGERGVGAPHQEWRSAGESGGGVAASRAWLSGRFMPWTNALCQSSMSFSCVLTVGS